MGTLTPNFRQQAEAQGPQSAYEGALTEGTFVDAGQAVLEANNAVTARAAVRNM